MLTFIRYIEVNVTFALAIVNCVRYNEDFVKSRFCSIHFTVILHGLKKIVRHNDLRPSLYRGSSNRGSTICEQGTILSIEGYHSDNFCQKRYIKR